MPQNTKMNPIPTKKIKQRIIVNSLTDTGVSFEVGNILIAIQQSLLAGIPSTLIAVIALITRGIGECRRAGIKTQLIPKATPRLPFMKKAPIFFDKMVESPNIGLEVSAVGLALASLTILVQAITFQENETISTLYHWGEEETILMMFAFANMFNGSAIRFRTPFIQNTMKSIGTISATIGLIMVNSDWMFLVLKDPFIIPNIILVIGGLQSIYQTITARPANKLLQPRLLLAAGCIGNSIINLILGNVIEGVANLIWASAFISLDSVFKKGGLHQKYFSR